MSAENGSMMSAAELKSKLYQTFKQKGWEDALKAQLRKRLVTELQQGALRQNFIPKSEYASDIDAHSLTLRAVNSLVADHLGRCEYEYSLSVFLPESETSKERMFTVCDLLQLLHVQSNSALFKKLTLETQKDEAKGFLWRLLIELVNVYGRASDDKGTQVNEMPSFNNSIEKKLNEVDEQYDILHSERKVHGEQAFQERLLLMQKEMESNSKTEMLAEISRYKETELKRIELQQRESSRKEISNARREMDATLRAKMEAVEVRERTMVDRIRQQQQTMDRETYSQRQSLLDQLRLLQHRETDLKREVEINERAAKMEEDKRKAIEENLKFREASVDTIEHNYARKFKEEVKRCELDHEVQWRERLHKLEKKEKLLGEEKKHLTEQKSLTQSVAEELKERKTQMTELEQQLREYKARMMSEQHRSQTLSEKLRAVVDYPTLKEEHAVLRRELENTKMRLAEAASDEKAEKRRNEELIKQLTDRMSRPSPELVSLRGELERTRDHLYQEKAISKQKQEHWNLKLQEETQKSLELKRQLVDQTQKMQEMLKELSNLRSILRETQVALQNEVYRNPGAPHNRPTSWAMPPTHSLPYAQDIGSPGGLLTGAASTEQTLQHLQLSSLVNRSGYRPIRNLDSSEDDDSLSSSTPEKSINFMEETRSRMRQLEMEAETLHRNYEEFQQRVMDPVSSYVNRNRPQGPGPDQLSLRAMDVQSSPGHNGLHSERRPEAVFNVINRNRENSMDNTDEHYHHHRNQEKERAPPKDHPGTFTGPTPGRQLFSVNTAGIDKYPVNIQGEGGASVRDQRSMSNEVRPQTYNSAPSLYGGHDVVISREIQQDTAYDQNAQGIRSSWDEARGGRDEDKAGFHQMKTQVDGTEKNNADESEDTSSEKVTEAASVEKNETGFGRGKRDDDENYEKTSEEEAMRRQEEEEQREWEGRRQKKEDDRRRKEEEARERERQILLDLQKQEQAKDPVERLGSPKHGTASSSPVEDVKDPVEAEAGEEDGLKIDPVMQKYMEMVQQKKTDDVSTRKEPVVTEKEESEVSVGRVSLGSISADERAVSPMAQEDALNSDDPFEDW